MAQYILQKRYQNHRGIDLTSSDIDRPSGYASYLKNAQFKQSGAIEKRKGYHACAPSVGGFGSFEYNRVNPETGVAEAESVTIDQNLYRYKKASITVNYAGAESTCLLSLFYDPDAAEYVCQIQEGENLVLDFGLGIGFDEASTVTLADLDTEISALPGFTASVSGSSSTPAAFVESIRTYDLTTEDWVGVARYSEQVNSTTNNPLSSYYSKRAQDDFENVSCVQIRNCLYFGSGFDHTMKYDGQTFYRAGLPEPASLTSVLAAGPGITGNNYFHKIQYIQYDAAGNVIEGNIKTTSTGVNAANQTIDVTIANIEEGSGFNTNCAIVDGAQAVVTTIDVDDGSAGAHTLKVGDTAYFFDAVSASYVEREVTAVTTNTITIAGAAVTVADNAVISNNLRIAIYRNKTAGSTPTVFYLIEEIPNDSFNATQVYNDNVADGSLGALLIPPVTDRSPPPKGKYVSQWNGQMTIAGNLDNQNILYYSDVDGPEYFPSDSNQLLFDSVAGDVIVGHAPNNQVYAVFGDRSFQIVSGDIATGQVRIDLISADIGCLAHASIKEVNGSLCFLSNKGPRVTQGGQVPQPLGSSETNPSASRIDAIMEQAGMDSDEELRFKRTVAVNDRIGQKLIFFFPAEQSSGSDRYANSNSKIFVYDYAKHSWLEWNNMTMHGGAFILGEDLFFQEKRYSDYHSAVKYNLYRRHRLNDSLDYQDNTDPIEWDYSSEWETLGEPALLKKFLRMRMFGLEDLPNNEYSLNVVVETNFQKDVEKASFELELPGAGYGETEYGVSAYGDPAETSVNHPLFRDRIRSMRLRFQNNADQQNAILTAWELECVAPFRAELKA